jgi:hypothetical protein
MAEAWRDDKNVKAVLITPLGLLQQDPEYLTFWIILDVPELFNLTKIFLKGIWWLLYYSVFIIDVYIGAQ